MLLYLLWRMASTMLLITTWLIQTHAVSWVRVLEGPTVEEQQMVQTNLKEKLSGEWKYVKQIGTGDFATVERYKNDSGLDVAVKRIFNHDVERAMMNKFKLRDIKPDELAINKKLRDLEGETHGLVKYYSSWNDKNDIPFLVFKYCGENLGRWLARNCYHPNKHNEYDERLRWSFLQQLADGLLFMHTNHIIHADFHSGNIFLDPPNVCIGDFGHSLNVDDIVHVLKDANHKIFKYDIESIANIFRKLFFGFCSMEAMIAKNKHQQFAKNLSKVCETANTKHCKTIKERLSLNIETLKYISRTIKEIRRCTNECTGVTIDPETRTLEVCTICEGWGDRVLTKPLIQTPNDLTERLDAAEKKLPEVGSRSRRANSRPTIPKAMILMANTNESGHTIKCSKCKIKPLDDKMYSKRKARGIDCLCLKHLKEYLSDPDEGATGKTFSMLFHDQFDFHWEDGKWKEIPTWKEVESKEKSPVELPLQHLNVEF